MASRGDNRRLVDSSNSKRECLYGENCYRRNPLHFQEFTHPHLETLLRAQIGDDIALPNGFKSSMDSYVIIEQLRIMSAIERKKNKESPERNTVEHCTDVQSDNTIGELQRKQETLESFPSEPTKIRTSPFSEEVSENSAAEQLKGHEDIKNKFSIKQESPKKEVKKARTQNLELDEEPKTKKRRTQACSGGSFLKKWESSLPYSFFLTTVTSSPRTHFERLSISFEDLLDSTLGIMDSSLQINFMVELDWLLEQYEKSGIRNTRLSILYGVEDASLKDKNLLGVNVKACHIKPPHPFGHHHTKMSIFKYTDGSVRVVVSTANLIASDWENRTQGVWVGPRCTPLPAGANTTDGESTTNFRADLVRYLSAYRQPLLQEWIALLRRTDFSAVRVCFVGSVPGTHKGPDLNFWGHMKLGHLLRANCSRACRNEGRSERNLNPWPVIIQCSSIGSLGAISSAWMCGEFRSSLAGTTSATLDVVPNLKLPNIKVVYPSLKNVVQSHDGLLGGCCLPYSVRTHSKQLWLSDYLHQWRSEARHRSQAVPHIKSYMRWNPESEEGVKGGQLAWFLLTSANLSKAAWGSLNKGNSGLYLMSYEAGVLFLPHFFHSEQEDQDGEETFPLSEEASGKVLPPFHVPYDLPLTPYAPGDAVWQIENLS